MRVGGCVLIVGLLLASAPASAASLNLVLTSEQQALLGCGEFFGTDCEGDGIDLLVSEASTLLQSFPDPVGGPVPSAWPPSGPVGTIFLPGARGPSGLPGDALAVPGTTVRYTPVVTGHPFAGQEFTSELAVLSWNMLMTLTAVSLPEGSGTPGLEHFDMQQPFRQSGCSYANPAACSAVQEVVGGSAPAVPEPGAGLLFAGGLALVAARLRRRVR